MSAQDDLIKQILASSDKSKWSGQGYGSAEKNAADMARIMAGIGITDVKQFGKIPTYEKAITKKSYNGQIAQQDEDGNYFISVNSGFDNEGSPTYSRQDVDPKDLQTIYGSYQSASINPDDGVEFVPADKSKVVTKDGVPMVQTGENFGNKLTGQAVPNTYTERQTGNFFGGTYEGKGNTGYGVQFDAKGNPIFYTQGASSSDIGQLAPLLTMASFIPGLQPFAMAANAAIAAKQGNALGVITNLAGMGGLAGISGMADVANAAKYANVLKSGDPLAILMAGANAGGVTDVGGFNLSDISKTIGGVKALQSGDPLAMLRYGMSAFPQSGESSATKSSAELQAEDPLSPEEQAQLQENQYNNMIRRLQISPEEEEANTQRAIEEIERTYGPSPATRSLTGGTQVDEADDFLKSIGINTIDRPSDSGLSNDDILNMVNADPNRIEIVGNKEPKYLPTDDDFMPTPVKDPNRIEIVGNLDKTKEHVFDPTFGGTMPLPSTDPNELVITGNRPVKEPTTETPTTPGATPAPKAPATSKAPTAPKAPAKPTAPTRSTAQQSAVREMAPALLGTPQLGNVFYYGKDFSSQRQELDPSGRLVQQEYDPLSVTQAGAEIDLDKMAGSNENDVQALIQQIMANSGGTATPEEIAQILGQQGNMYG